VRRGQLVAAGFHKAQLASTISVSTFQPSVARPWMALAINKETT